MKILKALAVTVLVLLLAISPALADSLTQPGTVSIVVLNDDGTVIHDVLEVPWVEGETVRTVMLNAADKEPSLKFESENIEDFGEYVTKIGDTEPGTEEFWALYINDEPSDEGIDTTVVNNGDIIIWQVEPIFEDTELDSDESDEGVI